MFIIAIYGWQFTRKRDLWGSLSTGVDKLPQRSTFTLAKEILELKKQLESLKQK